MCWAGQSLIVNFEECAFVRMYLCVKERELQINTTEKDRERERKRKRERERKMCPGPLILSSKQSLGLFGHELISTFNLSTIFSIYNMC